MAIEMLTELQREKLLTSVCIAESGLGGLVGRALSIIDEQAEALVMAEQRAKQAMEALEEGIGHAMRDHTRAGAAEARIVEQKKAHTERKRVIDEARAVIDDCFASGEPRCTAHALGALRKIICGTGI